MHDDARMPATGPDGSAAVARAYGVGAWLIGVVSIASMVSNGWVPLDEGTTLLAARWVEGGALPHRDFAYPFTGGLALLHALTERLVGDSMLAARLNLLAAFALWLPAVWLLARRFVEPQVAALAMVACAWWSVLVYPAAMPTWYVLFCATWATAALARWHDSVQRRWVVLAGVVAGVAVTFKQTGLATLVGAGLGLLAIHRQREASAVGASPQPVRNVFTLSLLAVAAVVPVAIVMRRGIGSGEALTIALPLAAVIIPLGAREWSASAGSAANRRLLAAWAALTAGALIPVLALVLLYSAHGALDSLVSANTAGVMRTAATIERAMTPWPEMLAYGLPAALVIGSVAFLTSRLRSAITAVAFGLMLSAAVLLAAAMTRTAYLGVWYGAQLLLPVAAVIIARRTGWSIGLRNADPIPLVIAAAAALLAINQMPYGAPNYFAYVAPLAILAALSIGRTLPQRTLVTALLALTAFGGWFHRIGSVHSVGFGPIWWDDAHALPGTYGRLRVTAPDSAAYARLTSLVEAHGGPERFSAGPELGALYALAGTQRVVAQPYLLTDNPAADSTVIAMAIDTAAVRAVVVNDAPQFLPRVSPSAQRWIEASYPNVERVGSVQFRWR